jgi:hypothetical protein
MLKYIGQFFEHEGIRVVDDMAVAGAFPESDEAYNRRGRLGVVADRPNQQDLADVEGRVLGILRQLHLKLPLGEKFL